MAAPKMSATAGSLYWAPPRTPPNNSAYGHFVVVVYIDEDNALLTTLTSVAQAEGQFMDDTCLLQIPRGYLQHPDQNREVYVRYD